MLGEILPGIFGALLLICLCQSTRLNDPVDVENAANTIVSNVTRNSSSTNQPRAGNARCLGTLKNWVFGASGMSGNPDDVRFYLYPNSLDRNYTEEIKYGDVHKLRLANLYPNVQLKIIIHGFTKNYESESVQLIKDAYLVRMAQTLREGGSGSNVILVDWEPLGKPKVKEDLEGLFYRLAVANVPVVGRRVGDFVQFLIKNRIVSSLKDVHIIGFSLGAHVAGHAGNNLKEFNAGQAPSRVTGLDPAGPAFYEKLSFSSRHLHKTDARFVDVIHSNMGVMGTLNALGHADFYPNGGGPVQRQCEEEYEQKRTQGEAGDSVWDSKLLMINSCSHNKAPQFFALSILNPQMIACKCESYDNFKTGACRCHEIAIFGEYCDPRTRGKFYLSI